MSTLYSELYRCLDLSKGGLGRSFVSSEKQRDLMPDDYGGYKALFSGGVTEVACWAHARRKFFDLDQGTPQGHPVAASVVSAIGALYAI